MKIVLDFMDLFGIYNKALGGGIICVDVQFVRIRVRNRVRSVLVVHTDKEAE